MFEVYPERLDDLVRKCSRFFGLWQIPSCNTLPKLNWTAYRLLEYSREPNRWWDCLPYSSNCNQPLGKLRWKQPRRQFERTTEFESKRKERKTNDGYMRIQGVIEAWDWIRLLSLDASHIFMNHQCYVEIKKQICLRFRQWWQRFKSVTGCAAWVLRIVCELDSKFEKVKLCKSWYQQHLHSSRPIKWPK